MNAQGDRHLFGRSARQGDPGMVEAIVCLEDELFVRYARHATRLFASRCLGDFRFQAVSFQMLVHFAQWNVESHNRRIRLETIKRDRQWLKALGFIGVAKN